MDPTSYGIKLINWFVIKRLTNIDGPLLKKFTPLDLFDLSGINDV